MVSQLETHNFGLETARDQFGVPAENYPSASDWPDIKASWAFGNPRCTSFSTITSNCSSCAHGAFGYQTQDIIDLSKYATRNNYDVIVWESVQQAYSTGQALIRKIIDELYDGYRIAHLFLNAASFGNSQKRRRYFFVAYKEGLRFNVEAPELPRHHPMIYDAIWDRVDRPTNQGTHKDYDEDSYMPLTEDEWELVPKLPNGWDVNMFAKWFPDDLPLTWQIKWWERKSEIPFSLHCLQRLNWCTCSPTLHTGASRYLHPRHNRPLTIGEISAVMGWPVIPKGPNPVQQIAKGVCPEVATWLAQQVEYCITGAWGTDDFESSYNHHKSQWVGTSTHDRREKLFNLTHYVSGVTPNDLEIPYGLREHRRDVGGRNLPST